MAIVHAQSVKKNLEGTLILFQLSLFSQLPKSVPFLRINILPSGIPKEYILRAENECATMIMPPMDSPLFCLRAEFSHPAA
jgi:hypothetical protein